MLHPQQLIILAVKLSAISVSMIRLAIPSSGLFVAFIPLVSPNVVSSYGIRPAAFHSSNIRSPFSLSELFIASTAA